MSALRMWPACALLSLGLAACQTPPPPTHAELVRSQLAELVAAQQQRCGAVQEYTRHDRLDYRVECASGQVYRVRVRADGRVTVAPYEPPR
jgi:hypothetical protein